MQIGTHRGHVSTLFAAHFSHVSAQQSYINAYVTAQRVQLTALGGTLRADHRQQHGQHGRYRTDGAEQGRQGRAHRGASVSGAGGQLIIASRLPVCRE